MAPNATTQSAHSSDQNTIDKNAVTTHFLTKFTDLQSRFDAPTDLFESKGKRFLETTIGRFVDQKEPITIVLPGFPTKTPNHGGKVLGPLPDRAEELALARLENFWWARLSRCWALRLSLKSPALALERLLERPDAHAVHAAAYFVFPVHILRPGHCSVRYPYDPRATRVSGHPC